MKKLIGLFIISFLCIALHSGCANPDIEKIPPEEMPEKAVMVNDVLYYYTGQQVELLRCGVMDGEITKFVSGSTLPAENDESNFGKGYEYQYVDENHIDVVMDRVWIRFCNGYCRTAIENGTEKFDTVVQDHSQTLTEELYSQWAGDFVPDYDTKYYDGIAEAVNPGGPDIVAHIAECDEGVCIADDSAACIRTDSEMCICGYPLKKDIKTFPGHIRIVE